MKTVTLKYSLIVMVLLTSINLNAANTKNQTWLAGVAKVNITPPYQIMLAGYASRTSPSTGKLTDLWAKAIFFEDAKGKQAVLVTSDLLGFPKKVSDNIRDRIEKQYGLSRDQVLLNSSHTHSAPVLENALVDIYNMDETQKQKVSVYSRALEDQIVELVGMAIKAKRPARIFTQNGATRFQVNRRNNKEASLVEQTELKGPNDFAVPVLKVVDLKDNKLMAVSFGYSCHPTVLSINEMSGDYAGFAQMEVEKAYPGVTALFFQCTGADQNPLPRRTVGLAKQYGKTLFATVERVLGEEMKELSPSLTTNYSEIDLKLSTPPSKVELLKIESEASGYIKQWATRMLGKINNGEKLMTSYPYPVQVWKLGNQVIVGLGGEVLVEYGINIKRMLGPDTFVLGYSNDVMAYIPSAKVLEEGGYEGETSQMVYGLPSKWDPGIEDAILNEVSRQAEYVIVHPGKKKVSAK